MARALIPTIHDWLTQWPAPLGEDFAKTYTLEPFDPAPDPILHLRADPGLHGVRVANIGATVVAVSQRRRLLHGLSI